MKVVIVDDEPLARARLEALLGECGGAAVVASVSDGEAALVACTQERPDLLLLDINMPGMDGTTLAQRLARLPRPPQVVFCTAYEQFAPRAFELGVVDYLLKPVRLERLREALERARVRMGAAPGAAPALTARSRDEERRIPLAEVIFLVADEKYVTVHHDRGEALIEDSLRQLEQAWPEHLLRVHRNCLVASARLLGIRTLDDGRSVVRLTGTEQTPEVSRRSLPAVRKHLRGEV
ncbi:LytR/AlgR family response regulator transcription factor [Oleiagrimonas soli]|uniref:LytTR family transcriptional regulator n=1 Tax=Oleiagrimonas soli TaxID=1543381 RepID=A0A099CUM3_9GAMM|nr:LytTR family DNA-binding domain-containing protein [Oleiagrimonas soli]KGI76710.1 LytTR family transcriptional regulator [Oleiagrimonas soli]MBB6185064.1 two-component system response regulator AlgR [Oleiagrimonas soli]